MFRVFYEKKIPQVNFLLRDYERQSFKPRTEMQKKWNNELVHFTWNPIKRLDVASKEELICYLERILYLFTVSDPDNSEEVIKNPTPYSFADRETDTFEELENESSESESDEECEDLFQEAQRKGARRKEKEKQTTNDDSDVDDKTFSVNSKSSIRKYYSAYFDSVKKIYSLDGGS